mgnify:CR=1 FL=1
MQDCLAPLLASGHVQGAADGLLRSAHDSSPPAMQALIDRNVIGDFRAPDILRFGFAPLYVRYVDIWDTIATLKDIIATGAWNTPEFRTRKSVT